MRTGHPVTKLSLSSSAREMHCCAVVVARRSRPCFRPLLRPRSFWRARKAMVEQKLTVLMHALGATGYVYAPIRGARPTR